MEPLKALVGKIEDAILNPLIILLFALALVYFLWGVFEFIKGADSEDARKIGKSHIVWGIVGMAIMFSVLSIKKIIENTVDGFGIDSPAVAQVLGIEES